MNKEIERSIESFNKRMVRHACGIFWPKRMSTEEVNVLIEPATCEVKKRRWQMLGHILRMGDYFLAKKQLLMSLKPKRKNEEDQIPAYLPPSKMT